MPVIIHCADIHIGSSSINFDNLIDATVDKINQLTPNIIVICGDIFHNNDTFTSRDLTIFNRFMHNLRNYQVILIPGNHDLNRHTGEDLLTPIVSQFANVHYLKQSGAIEIAGAKFYHASFLDSKEKITADISMIPDVSKYILLYHGMVNGIKFSSDVQITHDIMSKFACCMLGDVHQHQFIDKVGINACYSGSLTQLNVSESYDKGFVLWTYDRDPHNGNIITTSKFVNLNLPPNFAKVDLRGVSIDKVDETLTNLRVTAYGNLHRVNVVMDALDDPTRDVILTKVINVFGRVDHYAMESINGKPSDDIYEAITERLELLGATTEQMIAVDELHRSHMEEYEYSKWTVIEMAWSDLFQYGPHNHLNFESSGISGVLAPNQAGKSSIIDILVLALFGTFLKGDRSSMLRIVDATGKSVKQSHIAVTFISNNVKYVIDRVDTKTNTKLKLVSYANGTETIITPKDVTTCYQVMKKLIGTVDQFLSTGLYYDNSNDIVRMKNADRLKILPELFGLTDNEHLIKEVRAKIRSLSNELDLLTSGLTSEPLDILKSKLFDAKSIIKNETIRSTSLLEKINIATGMLATSRERVRLASMISESSLKCDVIEKQLRDNNSSYDKFEKLKLEDGILSSKFGVINRKLIAQLKDSTKEKTLAELQAECKLLEDSLSASPNGLKFNASCDDCKRNKSITDGAKDKKKIAEDLEKCKLLIEHYNDLDAIKRISEIRRELKLLPDVSEKIALEVELKMLKSQIKSAQDSLDLLPVTAVIDIKSLQNEYQESISKLALAVSNESSVNKLIGIRSRYDSNAAPIERDIELHKLYMKVIGDPNFKVSIIKKSVLRLMNHVNNTLKFAKFSMSAECDDKRINLYTHDGNIKLPIESGSGFKKFICSLAIRFALTSIITSSSQFMIIDEGFGCMDAQNLALCADMLPVIAQLYKFMFVISHMLALKSAFNYIHHIDIVDGISGIGVILPNVQPEPEPTPVQVPDGSKLCECGAIVKIKSLASHIKTAKHAKAIALVAVK
jgi:hypothetical protein